MDARAAIACAHCGSPVPGAVVGEAYCCAGCRTAAAVIDACGLGDYHRLRAALGPVDPVKAVAAPVEDDAAYADAIVARADGAAAIAWHVAGVRCAACVWLLERLPWLDRGIRSARLDLSAGSLSVVFDPAATSPARQVALARSLGYGLRAYAADDAARARVAERRSTTLRFAVALASALASMHLGLNVTAGDLAGDMDRATRGFFAAGSFAAALPALTWAAAPFWRGALASWRAGRWTLDATIAATLAIAIAAGAVGALAGGSVYADAAAMFVCLLLLARLALGYALDRATSAGAAIDGVLPRTARLILPAGGERVVAAGALVVGQRVRVAAGEGIPGDGIAEDAGWIETAVLTGEASAIAVAPGDEVLAGARSRADLVVRVTAAGPATRVGQLLARARLAAQRPRVDSAADRLQAWFAPAVLLLALGTGAWWSAAGARVAIDRGLAMVLVCCPCALALAGPLVRSIAIAGAARRGLLIRDPDAFERLRALRHVVLDKTGTLTAGAVTVARWDWIGHLDAATRALVEGGVLAAEQRSRHPAAAAIAAWLAGRAVASLAIDGWREIPGAGVECRVDGRALRVGAAAAAGIAGDGPVVLLDGVLIARLALDDPPRADAAALVDRLRRLGLELRISSGDAAAAVAAVAASVGIDRCAAGQSPEGKADLLARLRADGGAVMIGDGVNDAPALAAADVGIGIRGGLEPCLGCCAAFVARGGLAGAVDLIAASRRAHAAERLCLVVSLAYNLVGITAVAAGFVGPLVCAAAMPLSSATVVLLAWWRAPFSCDG